MVYVKERCSKCNKLLEQHETFYLNNDKKESTKSIPYCEFDWTHQKEAWEKIKHKYRPN